ncbi:toll/interleukin-1 receptor domain-containing protein [Streptomyces sp. NPDC085927]|uniref:toll/interleukin-1 receptor domain-containing protein n=1 Tax=Streptomyces sp. NPDC085927 TaxID=3365738 RepID=UPI0037D4C330
MRYAAFISYSHQADGQRARHLRQALHGFARPWNRTRALRVFLDNAALSADPGLWSTVEQALADSEFLVLLASPESARSPWVGKEITWWRQGPRPGKLLLVVTGGEVHWDHAAGDFDFERSSCLNEALRGHFTEEPRWVDLRWMEADHSGDLRDQRFQECVADVAAPLHARPKDELIGEDVSQRRRFRRFRQGMLAGMTALAVLATSAAVFAFVQRDAAREQARLATARQLAATALSLSGDDLEVASLLALQSYQLQRTPESLSALYRLSTESPRLVRFVRAESTVTALAFTSSPKYVAVGTTDGAVDIWTTNGSRHVRTVDVPGTVTALRFSDDDRMLAVTTRGGTTLVQDLRSEGSPRKLSGGDGTAQAMAFVPRGHRLATVDGRGTLRLYGEKGGKPVDSVRTGHDGSVMNITFLDDSTYGTVLFLSHAVGWDVYGDKDGRTTKVASSDSTVYPFNDYLTAASPTGNCFGFVKNKGVTLYSPAELIQGEAEGREAEISESCGALPGQLTAEADGFAISDDGRAAIGMSDGLVLTTSSSSERNAALETLSGVEAPSVLTFSPGEGNRLASADGDTVALWSLERPGPTAHRFGLPLTRVAVHARQPPLAVGPGGSLAWSDSQGFETTGNPRAWKPGDPADSTVAGQGEQGMYDTLAYDKSGRTLYTTTGDTLEMWAVSPHTLARKRSVKLARDLDFDGLTHIAARPDGKVAVVPPNGSVLIVDPATGERATAVKPRPSDLTAEEREKYDQRQFSRAVGEGGSLAAVAADGLIDVHELPSGKRLFRLDTGGSTVSDMFMSERNRTLFAVVDDKVLQSWDLATGDLRWRSDGAGAYGVTADPGGRWVATLAGNGTVWLWNARSGDRLGSFVVPTAPTAVGLGQSGSQTSLAFSPDGRTLWSVTQGGEMLAWDTSADAWTKQLCARVGRTLTESERNRYLTSLSDGNTACGE